MAVVTYITRENDVLDVICLKHYGKSDGTIMTMVIEYNYWLREEDPVLPAGIEIQLPDLPQQTQTTETVSLW